MKSLLKKCKRFILALRDTALLPLAFLIYGLTGRCPSWTGRCHINAFCMTGGRSSDWMSRIVSLRFPPARLEIPPGLLQPISEDEVRKVSATLDRDGYAILEQKLPDDVCDQLMQFALSQPASLRQMDGHPDAGGTAVYDPAQPCAVIYDFDKKDILSNSHVLALMTDPAILNIAQAYFRSAPIADMLSMWWSTAFGGKADSEAAQLFHFDMDRIKWIKVFIYLTEVGPENGPHYFVEGSHRTGNIPKTLLKQGYVRHQDEDIARAIDPKRIREFSAPRGTILIEDTRGLHKGQQVRHGHRLILQFQFSNSRFGPEIPQGPVAANPGSRFTELAKRYPRIFSGYKIQ